VKVTLTSSAMWSRSRDGRETSVLRLGLVSVASFTLGSNVVKYEDFINTSILSIRDVVSVTNVDSLETFFFKHLSLSSMSQTLTSHEHP